MGRAGVVRDDPFERLAGGAPGVLSAAPREPVHALGDVLAPSFHDTVADRDQRPAGRPRVVRTGGGLTRTPVITRTVRCAPSVSALGAQRASPSWRPVSECRPPHARPGGPSAQSSCSRLSSSRCSSPADGRRRPGAAGPGAAGWSRACALHRRLVGADLPGQHQHQIHQERVPRRGPRRLGELADLPPGHGRVAEHRPQRRQVVPRQIPARVLPVDQHGTGRRQQDVGQ